MSTLSGTIRPFIVAMAIACAGVPGVVSASDFNCEFALLDQTRPDGVETDAIAFYDNSGRELARWPLTLPYNHGGYNYASCEENVSFDTVQGFKEFRYLALLSDGGLRSIQECPRPRYDHIPQTFNRMCKEEEAQLTQILNRDKGGAHVYSLTTASTRCRKVSVGGAYFVTSACVR